ncbi:MAG: glycosyltransferase family 2 protein [Saprospiraceae bacterium]|nr:glycosyltransferase family 2 protein [Saprospiraceae bacterium]
MDITVVVPLFNEEESLPELEAWIRRVMEQHRFSYEIIMVDDGSNDRSWQVIESLSKSNACVRGIKFRRNYGKSAALFVGFEAAKGNVVITMDADLQDSPDEIPELRRMIVEDGYDLVSGWKQKRYDPIMKTIPSKFFNGVTRSISHIPLHDFNCGLKAYRIDVVKSIEIYGEMHRYTPLLAKWSGFKKIGEKVVEHRARKFGISKFGLDRFVNGFLDLLSITFIGKFGKRPMHFFGTWGVLFFMIGFVILVWLSFEKLFYQEFGIAERPMFFFGILTLIVGTQLFVTGFLAELLVRNSTTRNQYVVEKRT